MGSPNEPGGRRWTPTERPSCPRGRAPPAAPSATAPPATPVPPAPSGFAPAGAGTGPAGRASRGYVTGVAAPDLSSMGGIPQRPDPELFRTDRPESPRSEAPRQESRVERTEVIEAYQK